MLRRCPFCYKTLDQCFSCTECSKKKPGYGKVRLQPLHPASVDLISNSMQLGICSPRPTRPPSPAEHDWLGPRFDLLQNFLADPNTWLTASCRWF
jgi:hypothetical protein